jgi:hypothetical protein
MSKSALTWMVGAGLFATAISALIIVSDYKLSHSTHEKELGATLLELRTAQASVKSRVTDDRQTERSMMSSGTDDVVQDSKPPVTVVSAGQAGSK